MDDREKDVGVPSDVGDTLPATVLDALSPRRALTLALSLKNSETGFVTDSEVSSDGDTDSHAEAGCDWSTDFVNGEDAVTTKLLIPDKLPLSSKSARCD